MGPTESQQPHVARDSFNAQVIEVNSVINPNPSLALIADLPKDGPNIVGERRIYNPGDLLTLNCSSGKSHPASSLHWFINGVQVSAHSPSPVLFSNAQFSCPSFDSIPFNGPSARSSHHSLETAAAGKLANKINAFYIQNTS